PRGGEEGEPRRVAGREGPPAPLPEPPPHVARPHEHDVSGLDGHALGGSAAVEILEVDRLAGPERVHTLVARDIEEHAPGDDPVLVVLDAVSCGAGRRDQARVAAAVHLAVRSEEHTSELQSLAYLVCRLLLEKK